MSDLKYISPFTRSGHKYFAVRVPKPGGKLYPQSTFAATTYGEDEALRLAQEYRDECIGKGLPDRSRERIDTCTPINTTTLKTAKALVRLHNHHPCKPLSSFYFLMLFKDHSISSIELGELLGIDSGKAHLTQHLLHKTGLLKYQSKCTRIRIKERPVTLTSKARGIVAQLEKNLSPLSSSKPASSIKHTVSCYKTSRSNSLSIFDIACLVLYMDSEQNPSSIVESLCLDDLGAITKVKRSTERLLGAKMLLDRSNESKIGYKISKKGKSTLEVLASV